MNLEGKTLFGMPAWQVLLVLAGAGVVGYMLFFRNSGAGSGGSSAPTNFSDQGLAVMANPDYSGSISTMSAQLAQLQTTLTSAYEQQQSNQAESMANFTALESGPSDPRVAQWQTESQRLGQLAAASAGGTGAALNTISGQSAGGPAAVFNSTGNAVAA